VPPALLSEELCLEAVKRCGWALCAIPEAAKTSAVCLAAVQEFGCALRHVPEALLTPELCLEAVKQDGWALQDVPMELRTPELCLEAVKRDGLPIQFVPAELRTQELRDAAAASGPLMETERVPAGWSMEQDVDQPLGAVRARLAAVGITEKDVEDAVRWARQGGDHGGRD
jgi:hypothetical protein